MRSFIGRAAFLGLVCAGAGVRGANSPAAPVAATTTPRADPTEVWVREHIESLLQRKTFTASNGLALPYRIFVPEGISAEGAAKLPLLVYLHGRGERGTDNRPALYNRSGLFMGARSIISPAMQRAFPCVILVPQCSDKTVNEEWAKWVGNTPETPFKGLNQTNGSYQQAPEPSDSGRAVLELIDATIAQYPVDPRRVYLTGVSMGGFGTWEFVMRRPELFAAAAPMAGYSDQSKVETIKHIPFWIFHGGADESNPVQGSRNMARLLKEAGAEVRYTEYPETRHGASFQKAWAEPELLGWLFSHRK